MAQRDTLEDVLRRGLARSEELTTAQVEYLALQVIEALKEITAYSAVDRQALTHDHEGNFTWQTGLNAEVDTAATPTLVIINGIVTDAVA
jgi:hypothetical protein